MDLSHAEWLLLSALGHYGRRNSPSEFCYYVAGESPHLGGQVTEEECQAALVDCISKGWLQVIDEPALAKIADELREGGILGPVGGLPWVGMLDFTSAGAELWQRCYG